MLRRYIEYHGIKKLYAEYKKDVLAKNAGTCYFFYLLCIFFESYFIICRVTCFALYYCSVEGEESRRRSKILLSTVVATLGNRRCESNHR